EPDRAASLIAGTFRAWARSRAYRIEEGGAGGAGGLRIHATIAGRDVSIDPGVDTGAAGWVAVTIAIAFPGAPSVLVTRATQPCDPLSASVRALFDAPGIGPEPRAVSVAPARLRLRLGPGTAPDVVAEAVEAVAGALRARFTLAAFEG